MFTVCKDLLRPAVESRTEEETGAELAGDNDAEVTVGSAGSGAGTLGQPILITGTGYSGTRADLPPSWRIGDCPFENDDYSTVHPLMPGCRLYFSVDNTHILKCT
jgi:hypothetical protein